MDSIRILIFVLFFCCLVSLSQTGNTRPVSITKLTSKISPRPSSPVSKLTKIPTKIPPKPTSRVTTRTKRTTKSSKRTTSPFSIRTKSTTRPTRPAPVTKKSSTSGRNTKYTSKRPSPKMSSIRPRRTTPSSGVYTKSSLLVTMPLALLALTGKFSSL